MSRPTDPDPASPPEVEGKPGSPAVDPPLPSTATMAGYALGAVGRFAASIARGDDTAADEELKGRRISTCDQCEHFRRTDFRCAFCGCYLRIKVSLIHERCPIGKW